MRPIFRILGTAALAVAATSLATTVASAQETAPASPDDTAPAATESDIAAADAAAAAGRSLTVFNTTMTATANSYWEPRFSGPGNWVSPVNYAGGTSVWKLTVKSKPSSKPVLAQVCMWRNRYTQETCAKPLRVVDEGSWTVNLGSAASWWDKGGGYSFTSPPDVVRILLKDPANGTMWMASKCRPVCYRGSDLNQHVPITMTSSLVLTAR